MVDTMLNDVETIVSDVWLALINAVSYDGMVNEGVIDGWCRWWNHG